jgi:hypothetical protein
MKLTRDFSDQYPAVAFQNLADGASAFFVEQAAS